MPLKTKMPRSNDGFTIVELMIATAILATMLVLVTVLMINVGNLYYKGINQSRAQGDVRNITDEVSQQLEVSNSFSTAPTDVEHPTDVKAYCIGTTRYTFITGVQIGHPEDSAPTGSTPYYHVLWRDTNPTPGNCAISGPGSVNLMDQNLATDDAANDGTELVSPNSTLTAFCIGTIDSGSGVCSPSTTSPYSISVGVAYGDHDLLNNPNSINATCKGNIGDQFCATASLSTVAVQRLTGN